MENQKVLEDEIPIPNPQSPIPNVQLLFKLLSKKNILKK